LLDAVGHRDVRADPAAHPNSYVGCAAEVRLPSITKWPGQGRASASMRLRSQPTFSYHRSPSNRAKALTADARCFHCSVCPAAHTEFDRERDSRWRL